MRAIWPHLVVLVLAVAAAAFWALRWEPTRMPALLGYVEPRRPTASPSARASARPVPPTLRPANAPATP